MFSKPLSYKILAYAIAMASIALIWPAPGAKASEAINVYMNQARILKFDEPVSKVIIGNSEIADVTVSDPQTVILTAKSFGSTNLVILDGLGEPVVDKRIVVTVDEENTVRVFRQVARTVMSCSPICEGQNNQ